MQQPLRQSSPEKIDDDPFYSPELYGRAIGRVPFLVLYLLYRLSPVQILRPVAAVSLVCPVLASVPAAVRRVRRKEDLRQAGYR